MSAYELKGQGTVTTPQKGFGEVRKLALRGK